MIKKMNFDSMKKEYIYKVLKGMPANIFMILLVVVNYIAYVNSPFDKSDGNILRFILFGLPFLLIAFIGICFLIRTLYKILKGKEVQIVTRIVTYFALFSLFLVTYGTFFKSRVETYMNELDRVIIKSYGGEVTTLDCYIWRNDTIISRENINGKFYIDTMIVDAENKSCYWTYKPKLKYDIILDHRYKFEESPKNMTFGPSDYMEKFEYIINSVSNKHLDQYYCDTRTYCRNFENDSILYFFVGSPEKLGYVQFRKEDSIAVFSDSSSNIKTVNDSCIHIYRVNYLDIVKENGMPLLDINELVHECGGRHVFANYYDIEKKDFVLRVQTIEEVETCGYIYVRLYGHYDYNRNGGIPVELRDCNSDIIMKEGYPIIKYIKIHSADTLEIGQYEMENGEYVKKVIRAGDYDFAKTN